MIRKLLLAAAICAAAPQALAQVPPEIQAMVDNINIGVAGGPLAPVEKVPLVFARTATGDFLHKTSGFVCPHTPAALLDAAMLPGIVVLYDDPTKGEDISCGMFGEGLNYNLFVFRRPGTIGDILRDESGPARHDFPPARDTAAPKAATADSLGLPEGAPFASDTWAGASGNDEALYVTRIGTWFVVARISSAPEATARGLEQTKRLFTAAAQQIVN